MRTAIALASLLAVALAMPSQNADDAEWEQYKAKYGKNYNTNDVESVRKNIYFTAKAKVEKHNALHRQGKKSYRLALNQFADMLPTEVAQMLNGYKRSSRNSENEVYVPTNVDSLPATVDWRKKGAVTPIKNQGQCGSCWAFSTTGSLEGQTALKKGKLVSLSEQNLVDCSANEGNEGCEGGLMDNGFAYIKKHGIDTEASYPYTAEDGTCQFSKSNVGATLTSWVDITSGSESALQAASANIGPISVAIDASSWDFQLYESGVYDESDCSTSELDHGVLVVGYGTDNSTPYWLVKNSWGTSWGIDGYIKMSRNKSNQCGIATEASYPVV